MEAKSVHMVVTSPPYYGLRDYKIEPSIWGGDSKCRHQWKSSEKNFTRNAQKTDTKHADRGGNPYANRTEFDVSTGEFCTKCNAWRGTFGLEPDVEMYVEHSVEIFKAVWRVLRDDGTLWINLGDSYATNRNDNNFRGTKRAEGKNFKQGRIAPELQMKNLLGMPWRVAFALQKAGWYLRSDIVWSKNNSMPESVTDRCARSHEYIFMLTKKPRYYFDAEAIKEKTTYDKGNYRATFLVGTKRLREANVCSGGLIESDRGRERINVESRNKRSVWEVSTHPFPGAHFATFPPKLIEPCIRAGTSSKGCCEKCGAPWIRQVEINRVRESGAQSRAAIGNNDRNDVDTPRMSATFKTIGWKPSCNCKAKIIPCTVLDPFGGSGTTGIVCSKLERDAILIEISPKYAEMARRRVGQRFAEIWNIEDD